MQRRHFIAGVAAAAGVSVLDGFGFSTASTEARSAAREVDLNPSRRIEDYPHIIDAIPSRDMHRYFPLIVDACADPAMNYLSRVPFLIELEVAKIWSESRFDWDALSVVGAAGLQQLMDFVARDYGLAVAETPEIQAMNSSIAEFRRLRSETVAKRQELYRLAEGGSGPIAGDALKTMNTLRAELAGLDGKRTAAYQDLKAARSAYVDMVRGMTVEQRKRTDARFVPELHIPEGVRHLFRGIMECKDYFGGPVEMNVWRGIAAYNSGLATVKRWSGLPFIEETVHFTRNVISDLTRALEMKYAYSTRDPALIAETRTRIRLRSDPYFMYAVRVGDTFFRIVREQVMERYDLSYSEALQYVRDADGSRINNRDMSVIVPDQQFRIYYPE